MQPARLCILLLAELVLGGCTPSPRPYAEEIGAWHAEKDQFMRPSPESPVPEAQRATFPPLAVLPVNEEYRVPAALKVIASSQVAGDADVHRAGAGRCAASARWRSP